METISSFIIGILVQLYLQLGNNMGLALIVFTLLVRTLFLPLTIKSIKAHKEITKIQPELKKLKEKHGSDKAALQKESLELYQKYNVNPLAGCLPQLLQLGLLFVLYQVLINFFDQSTINGVTIDPMFYWLNLSQPDPYWIMPILSGVTQLIFSLMLAPATEIPDRIANAAKTPILKNENKKEEDFAEMAASMQSQMLFLMPVMTAFIALRLPSGLALYWVVTTVFSIVQQWWVSGPGGLVSYTQRAWHLIKGGRS
jgi:YidC/Oxa1 family membrane protein insertase